MWVVCLLQVDENGEGVSLGAPMVSVGEIHLAVCGVKSPAEWTSASGCEHSFVAEEIVEECEKKFCTRRRTVRKEKKKLKD